MSCVYPQTQLSVGTVIQFFNKYSISMTIKGGIIYIPVNKQKGSFVFMGGNSIRLLNARGRVSL